MDSFFCGSDAFGVGGGAGAGCGRCVERHFFAQERDVANRGSVKSSPKLEKVTNLDADFFLFSFFELGVDCHFNRIMEDTIPKSRIGGLLTTTRADDVNLRVGERGHRVNVGGESERVPAKERYIVGRMEGGFVRQTLRKYVRGKMHILI